MTYRRALLVRWSRRDRLAVLVVAVTVAFLVGATILVLGAGAQTAAIAADYDATGTATIHESVAAATDAAPDDAIVLPLARVTGTDGSTRYVVGRPDSAPVARELELDGRETTLGTVDDSTTLRLSGSEATVSVDATPRGRSLVPRSWVVTDGQTVRTLGPTGAVAVRPSAADLRRGVPLRAALAFFVLGTQQALAALSIAILGGGLLVAVTVYSVTRMTVRDRMTAIRVVRSTGGTPGAVLALFALRAALLSTVGAALGYALGVILPNAAISVAVTAGLPISLDASVSASGARLLVPALGALLVVGTVAGAVASWPAVRRPPGTLTATLAESGSSSVAAGRLRAWVRPNLLQWRAVVPTTATLTAFVLFAVLVSAVGGVVAPMAAADATTVTAPDASHPFASSIPEAYADALRTERDAASPEILLLSVSDGQPFLARGARFDAFAAVTPATLESGWEPSGPAEAVIGTDLARTLDVDVGDELLLGGSTESGIATVVVVGTYRAPAPFDAQLVVPLDTARDLAGRPAGHVHLVRTTGDPGALATAPTLNDTSYAVTVPDRVPADGRLDVRITLRNPAAERREVAVPVRLEDDERRLRATLAPGETREERVTFGVGDPGDVTLSVGELTRTVRVVHPDAIDVSLPSEAPPGSEPLLTVTNASGVPVDARVSVGNHSIRTGSDGRVRVPLESTGNHTVVAEHRGHTATATVDVASRAQRQPQVSLDVVPPEPSLLVRPEARLTLANPWNVTWSGPVELTGPDRRLDETVSLAPGDRTTLALRLDRQPPGTYAVGATIDRRERATTEYTVTGDERLAAALASSGRSSAGGIGRAIETAFGNLRLVLGVVLGLACLMTVGGTTATFASAVHARRSTIGVFRATGAGPARVARVVLGDALRLGVLATALGLLLGIAVLQILHAAGYLTVFGVSLSPIPSGPALLLIAVAGLGLTVIGAGLALYRMVSCAPGALLVDGAPRTSDRGL